MAVKKPAPRSSCGTSDAMHFVDDASGIAADIDLTALTGKPRFPPQRTLLWVDTLGASIVLVDEAGVSSTITVPANGPLELHRPIKQLTKSGSGNVNALFEWFDVGTNDWNP